ncbi:MAG: hypothetical protein ABL308_14575 [Oceanicaulis sp.]
MSARMRRVTGFAALAAVLSLAACSTGVDGLDPAAGLMAAETTAERAPSIPMEPPGYALSGREFAGDLVFSEEGGRPVALYTHAVDGAPTLIAELTPERDWLSDGVRRFEGVSDRGVEVSVEMVSGPCVAGGRTHARFATVQAGRLTYQGCARETGPVISWTETLPDHIAAVNACAADSVTGAMAAVSLAGPPRVVHVREDGAPVVRFTFGGTGRWDCRAGSRISWRVVPDAAPALPGEGAPIFAPGRPPRAGQGCYLWERMVDGEGAVIGAIGEDVCSTGPTASLAPGAPGLD